MNAAAKVATFSCSVAEGVRWGPPSFNHQLLLRLRLRKQRIFKLGIYRHTLEYGLVCFAITLYRGFKNKGNFDALHIAKISLEDEDVVHLPIHAARCA